MYFSMDFIGVTQEEFVRSEGLSFLEREKGKDIKHT